MSTPRPAALLFGSLLASFVCLSALRAQVWPQTTYLQPHGSARGTTVDVEIRGRNLGAALGLSFDRPGIRVLRCKSVTTRHVRARLAIDANAALGVRQLRVHTESGLSGVELFFVDARPSLREKESNDTPETAQVLPLDRCVDASFASGDRDLYCVEIDRPMRLRAEVVAMRLGDSEIDARLRILDGQLRELAAVGDTRFGRMDPWVAVEIAEAGRYYIEVREDGWRGAPAGADYRLHVGRFARPIAVTPLSVRPGQKAQLSFRGDGAAWSMPFVAPRSKEVARLWPSSADIPATCAREAYLCEVNRTAPTPLLLRVKDQQHYSEADARRALKEKKALSLPASLVGVLAKRGEQDQWRIRAKKGERFTMQVLARLLRSPIDAALYIREVGGDFRQYVDDSGRSVDPRLSFRAPKDASYDLFVSDRMRGGSEAHAYVVEITRDRDARGSARILPAGRYEDHAVHAPRGGRAGFRLATQGLPPKTRVRLRGLPAGCRAEERVVARGRTILDMVVHAKASAALACARVALEQKRPNEKAWSTLPLLQPLVLVRVRNQQPYLTVREDRIPFAVTRAPGFALRMAAPKAPLLRASPMSLAVQLTRPLLKQPTAKPKKPATPKKSTAKKSTAKKSTAKKPAMQSGQKKGAKKSPKPRYAMDAVRVRLLEAPPGVRANAITVSGTKASLYLSASSAAALGKHRVHAVARISKNGGFFEWTSPPIEVHVAEQHNRVRLGTTRLALASDKAVFANLPLEHSCKRPWKGSAKLELRGLPKGAKLVTTTLDAKTKLSALRVQLAPGCKPGRYRNLLLRMRIPSPSGGIALEDWRGGELRIDRAPAAEISAGGRP